MEWYHLGPYRVTPNKWFWAEFDETVYISEINGAVKFKCNAQVAMNKNSDHMQKLFPLGWLGRTVPAHIWNCPK